MSRLGRSEYCTETEGALFQKHVRGGLPVAALIYFHTHGDHWGGARGLISEEDVRSGKVQVIAPADFKEFTISENVYARDAMNRRLFYRCGLLLASPGWHPA